MFESYCVFACCFSIWASPPRCVYNGRFIVCVSRLVFFSSESRVYFDQSDHSVVSSSLMCFVARFGSSSSLVDYSVSSLHSLLISIMQLILASLFCVLDVVVFIYVSHMLLHVKFHRQILGFCCCVARYETTLNCLGIKQLSFYRGGCHGRLVSSSSLLYVPLFCHL